MPKNSRNVYGYVAPNGLNFSRCIYKNNSRISRALRYIQSQNEMGKAVTRKDILRDVFNKDANGWGSYLFTFGVKNKFMNKVRIGKTFVYSAGRRSHLVSI